jgi:hypothetical protein
MNKERKKQSHFCLIDLEDQEALSAKATSMAYKKKKNLWFDELGI